MHKPLGIIYITINAILLLTLLALALNGTENHPPLYLEWIVLIVPAIGILSGYWISAGQHSSKKILLIILSLFITFATVFVALVVLPLVERANIEQRQEVSTSSANIDQHFDIKC